MARKARGVGPQGLLPEPEVDHSSDGRLLRARRSTPAASLCEAKRRGTELERLRELPPANPECLPEYSLSKKI